MRTTIRIAVLAAGALGAYSIYQSRRREAELLANAGSTTNCAPVEPAQLSPDCDADEALDVAVEQSFPASDPIAIQTAYENRS